MLDANNALSVSQLNSYIKRLLWQDDLLRQLVVRGEISNIRDYHGHLYFSLKDEECSVRAVMWNRDRRALKFVPEDGMQVLVSGNVSLYERDGVYQVYAAYMEPFGFGAIYAALEQLKKRLESEGLFSPERKKKIPAFPRKIGIVTSLRGAAIKDIVSVGRRRYPGVRFVVVDSKVQGDGAAAGIVKGIQVLNGCPEVDVIVVSRGGGSQEDLFVFNDESIARAVVASAVPVVSAVGHERDVTVTDLVADARAPTPSAAAEMVVPNARELLSYVVMLREHAFEKIYSTVNQYKKGLKLILTRPALQRPDWYLASSRERLLRLIGDMEYFMVNRLQRERYVFEGSVFKLNALSPLKVLARGYSLTRRIEDMSIIKSADQAPAGSRILVTLNEGLLECTVDESVAGKEENY